MLWKCCTQYASKFGKLSSGHRIGKGQFSSQSQKEAMPRNEQTTVQLHSHASKVKLKILQARLQQNVNCELADVQAGFRKDRGTRYQIANIRGKKLKQWETLFWGLKNHCRWLTVALKLKRLFLFGRKVMTNLDSILKKRHYFADKGLSSQSYGSGFSGSHV